MTVTEAPAARPPQADSKPGKGTDDREIDAIALRGKLFLEFEGREVTINLAGFRLAEVIAYIERRTGLQVNLLAGLLGTYRY